MSLTTKAIFAALTLTLAPAMASAQSFSFTSPGGGYGINLGINPYAGIPGVPMRPPIPVQPVQAEDCGAQQYRSLVGHHVSVAHSYGIQARYFTPDSPYGTLNFLPRRLNINTDDNYIIDRVYCG
ncbi:hypothetical protein [Gymnodinialimonas sp. 57CJ19]|uniref:hypothetical protein n=1 Tax=Gymnodinialimonas sp. 57CJ19 TaxID=3138498 RepID=UPI00313433BB